jgi:hypothetical protein
MCQYDLVHAAQASKNINSTRFLVREKDTKRHGIPLLVKGLCSAPQGDVRLPITGFEALDTLVVKVKAMEAKKRQRPNKLDKMKIALDLLVKQIVKLEK